MGKANFKHGNSIRVGGHFCVGDGFDSNVNCFFSCNHEIIIGADCLLGWNVNIRDSDNHMVLVDGIKSPTEKSVVIGDHVWLCSYVDILKGVRIPNESIVAYRAQIASSSWTPSGRKMGSILATVLVEASDSTKIVAAAAAQAAQTTSRNASKSSSGVQ